MSRQRYDGKLQTYDGRSQRRDETPQGSGSDSSLGSFLTFVGGGLVGAALAYAATNSASSNTEGQHQCDTKARQAASTTGYTAHSAGGDKTAGYSARPPPNQQQYTRSSDIPSATASTPSTSSGNLVGEALAYGAKKVSSYFEEQQQREAISKQEMGYGTRSPCNSQPSASRAPESRSSASPGESDVLHERLTSYYSLRVDVSESGLSELSHRLDSIRAELQQALSENLGGNVKVNIPTGTGFLQSIIIRHYQDVTVSLPMIIELDERNWCCVRKDDDPAGYYSIVKVKFDKPDVCDPWIRSRCLDPFAVQKACARIVRKTISLGPWNQPLESSSMNDVPVIKIKGESASAQSYNFKVKLNPACRVNDVVVEAVPTCERNRDSQKLWRKNFSVAFCIPILNPTQIKCVRTLASISAALTDELGFLTIEMLHSLVLHVAEMEDNWVDLTLPERFIDLLKTFEEYCIYKKLAHYFIPRLNLLADVSDRQLELAAFLISKNIGRNTPHHLLV